MSKFLQTFNRGLFGATLAGGLAFSLGAHARTLTEDDIRYCAAFASKNQEMQSVIRERGCSFPPSPRLTDSYMQRYEWCTTKLGSDPSIAFPGFGITGLSDVDWEYQTMLKMIGQCKALSRENDEPNKRATCDAYADEAVKYATEFRQNNCVVAPELEGRFSLSREEHFNWCLYSATREGWSNERRARYNETNQCTKGVQCRKYAKDAVSVAKQINRKGCKENPAFEGRYSEYESDHYNWCMGAPAASAENEQNARNEDLTQCIPPPPLKIGGARAPVDPSHVPGSKIGGLPGLPGALPIPTRMTPDVIRVPTTPDAITLPRYPNPRIPSEEAERARRILEAGGRKIIDYGKRPPVDVGGAAYEAKEKLKQRAAELPKPELGRAAYVAKEKLKQRLYEQRPRLGSGLRTRLSAFAKYRRR